jgi:hypothetical protein
MPETASFLGGEGGDRKPFKMALNHQEGSPLITIVLVHPRKGRG